MGEREDFILKMVTILSLAVILLVSVIGIILTALLTDRDVARAEKLSFGGVIMLAALGGLTWSHLRRRRRWRIEREEED
jgi:glucose-6-phosphate-specific signal transduction histidine kinase